MEYLSEILSFVGGLVSGITAKFLYDRSQRTNILQVNNRAGGDIAGRDIKKGP
jgi:hypothetical protein